MAKKPIPGQASSLSAFQFLEIKMINCHSGIFHTLAFAVFSLLASCGGGGNAASAAEATSSSRSAAPAGLDTVRGLDTRNGKLASDGDASMPDARPETLSGHAAASQTSAPVGQDENLIPPIPDVPQTDTDPVTRSPYGLGKKKLPPPPQRASCIGQGEYDAALYGSGCDCSCEGYAKGPSAQCQTACGLTYYNCWAPDPTPAELGEQLDDPAARQAMEALSAAEKAEMLQWQRATAMLNRADAWMNQQRCTESK